MRFESGPWLRAGMRTCPLTLEGCDLAHMPMGVCSLNCPVADVEVDGRDRDHTPSTASMLAPLAP